MKKIFITIVFATIIISVSAQRNQDRDEVSFKSSKIKIVGNKMNVYFDITGISDTSQFSYISNAIESNSEVIKSRVFISVYGTVTCMMITTLNVKAIEIRNILRDINLDFDNRTVRINNKKVELNNTLK